MRCLRSCSMRYNTTHVICHRACNKLQILLARLLLRRGWKTQHGAYHTQVLVADCSALFNGSLKNIASPTRSTQAPTTPSSSTCASANTATSRSRDRPSPSTHRRPSSSVARSRRRRRHSPRAARTTHTSRRRRRSSSPLPLILLSLPLCLFTPSLLVGRSSLCLGLSSDFFVLKLFQILSSALPLRVQDQALVVLRLA